MRLRVGGTSEREDSGYYLRDEFEIEQAFDDGFKIFKGSDGWYYGDRRGSGGWTARALPLSPDMPPTNGEKL